MTRRRLRLTLASAALLASTILVPLDDAEASIEPVLGSTFLDTSAATGWSSATWHRNFDEMQEAGIREVILNITVRPGEGLAYYPTGIPGLEQVTDQSGAPVDVVGLALAQARAHGMTVWLGLALDPDAWYSHSSGDPEWLHQYAIESAEVAADLAVQFDDDMDLVTGWYFPGEDSPWADQYEGGEVRHAFYLELGDVLDDVRPDMDIMISPYYVPESDPRWRRTSEDFTAYFAIALRDTSIDVVAEQAMAGIGFNPTDRQTRMSVVTEWMRAVVDGVAQAGNGAEVWANVELFADHIGFTSVEDVVATMQAVSPYVSKFTSWSYPNQWATAGSWGASWWHDAYVEYVNTGEVPARVPDAPLGVRAEVAGGEARLYELTVYWTTPAKQNIAYLELLKRTETGFELVDTAWNSAPSVTVPYEAGSSYFLRTRNAAGIRSTPVPVPAGDPGVSAVWSVGASYSASSDASTVYPDSGGRELTDGEHGAAFNHPAWQGREHDDVQSYTVDLGSLRPVQSITIGALQFPSYGIALPGALRAETSSDGEHWVSFGSTAPTSVSTGRNEALIDGLATARFIRVVLEDAPLQWVFLDEITVKG